MRALHKDNVKQVLRTGVHVARRPGSAFSTSVSKRLSKRGFKHRIFDVGIVSALVLILVAGAFMLFRTDPGRRVAFTAVVAPAAVVSGGDSTLSINYTNNSKKTLQDVTLTLTYPPFFALQDVDHPSFEPETNTIELGELAPGANGLVKIRGVMFGDVGGEQTFTSTLGYAWDAGKTGVKEQTYRFSPGGSALTIETQLPDRLVSGQRIAGSILLRNEGSITFPEASIHAVFPDDFQLRTTSIAQRNDATWIVPSIEPGDELTIEYTGNLALNENEEATFLFEPSFVFGDERFVQDTLTETVSTVQPPVSVQLENLPASIRPGVALETIVSWDDQTDLAISNVQIHVEGATNEPEWSIDTPVTAGSRTVSLVPRSGAGTNRTAVFTPVVTFILDETGETVTIVGEPVESLLTTSVRLGGFARYFTSAGDQLGRGPLPPRVGDETIYWAFLNVQDTFNDLTGVTVTATLPANVNWINRQSVTKGSGVTYNGSSIRWNLGNLDATVANGTVAAASFALGITPSANQTGTAPPILTNIRVEGRDVWTGELVTKTLNSISTKVSEDNGIVQ